MYLSPPKPLSQYRSANTRASRLPQDTPSPGFGVFVRFSAQRPKRPFWVDPLRPEKHWANRLPSPEFIRTHALHEPQDLLRVPLIPSSVSVVQWPEWFARFSGDLRPDRMGLRFDRAMVCLDAAEQKLGVALESTRIGQSLIASGKLQPIFAKDMCIQVQAHFMVYPARHAWRPEVKSFLEWLRKEAGPAQP